MNTPALLRLAGVAVVYALQRAEAVADRLARVDGCTVVVLMCRWSLAPDAWVDRDRLFYDAPDFVYPERVHRVDRLGPWVLVANCAEESRGTVFVLLASREVTDGSQARAWARESGMDDVVDTQPASADGAMKGETT